MKIASFQVTGLFDRFNHEAKLYVNGSLDGTVSIGSDTGELDWQGRADVGGYSKYSAKQTFQGLIDDARYYDVVLTSPEIRSLFNDSVGASLGAEADTPSSD